MPLDPQVRALRFQREREKTLPLYTLSVEQARQTDLASVRAGEGTLKPVAQVINCPIPGSGGAFPRAHLLLRRRMDPKAFSRGVVRDVIYSSVLRKDLPQNWNKVTCNIVRSKCS